MSEVFIIPDEAVVSKIYYLRDKKVILDSDLAELYDVETRILNQQVKRNEYRFPEDFMFQLSEEEFEILKSQNVMSRWGGRRTLPFAFTEHCGLRKKRCNRKPRWYLVTATLKRETSIGKV